MRIQIQYISKNGSVKNTEFLARNSVKVGWYRIRAKFRIRID